MADKPSRGLAGVTAAPGAPAGGIGERGLTRALLGRR
jgi:hypothetical protein